MSGISGRGPEKGREGERNMEKKIFSTDRAPAAIGPYSQAVGGGGLIFLSGQIPIDLSTGALAETGIGEQTEMVLAAAGKILESSGSDLARVVKVTVYMSDLGKFQEMNEVYARFFPGSPPARSAVQVAALPKGAEIEVEMIALEGRE
jgi:2-iminobutanoate/2-iminopropanoate deaminase